EPSSLHPPFCAPSPSAALAKSVHRARPYENAFVECAIVCPSTFPPDLNYERNKRKSPIQPPREGRHFRSSARASLFIRNRNVGALLLLRDARAAHSLHGQIPA